MLCKKYSEKMFPLNIVLVASNYFYSDSNPKEKHGKTPNFSGRQHFNSYFQNPSKKSVETADTESAYYN